MREWSEEEVNECIEEGEVEIDGILYRNMDVRYRLRFKCAL